MAITKSYTLSIETAVRGGSLALLEGDSFLDGWVGTLEISRSEDVLVQIKNILDSNNVARREIKKIFVSRGPGSYTGARIGLAVGIGLKKAFGCNLVSINVLKALLSAYQPDTSVEAEEIVTIIPYGRNQLCRQSFKFRAGMNIERESCPEILKVKDLQLFCDPIGSENNKVLVMHREVYLEFKSVLGSCLLIDAGENLSVFIAKQSAISERLTADLSPIYLREDDFRKIVL